MMRIQNLNTVIFSTAFIIFFYSCVAQKPSPGGMPAPEVIAFPGAEGFGKYASGGRGGKVVVVSNLNDSGEGSLRNALQTSGPRIVVFSVAGTIHLQSPLTIKSNTTIAGQSAPGDGICIADHPVSISGDNVIVRYMRFRMGDRFQGREMVHGSGHDDALSSSRRKNIIIDHCSLSWSTDEVLSVYNGDSTTLQWNIISEPLNYSYHFERGKTDFEEHGFGGIMGGKQISIYYNLFAHCKSRTPRFDGNRNLQGATEFADYRNNVIYNWGNNNVYGGEGGRYNVIANYYKPGPSTVRSARNKIANPFKNENIPFGKWYVAENIMDGAPEITKDNWLGVTLDKGTEADKPLVKQASAFEAWGHQHLDAVQAFIAVLQNSGASYRRDTLDERIINDVKYGRGRLIDVQGGFAHGTAYEKTVSAWPFLDPGTAPTDTDKDGMPDAWEKAKGLDPLKASDATEKKLDRNYTNIEVYLNELVSSEKI